tara:strand:- start:3403 stop:3570 length:168 start_codon:yes stop_codon:yes gene_type:complete
MIRHHIYCADCDLDMTIDIKEAREEHEDLRPVYCPMCGEEELEVYNEELEDGDLL